MARAKRFKTATIYIYVETINAQRAKVLGRTKFSTTSNYINYLIAKDAGDKASVKRTLAAAKSELTPPQVRTSEERETSSKKVAKKAAKKKAAKKATKKVAKKVAKKAAKKATKKVAKKFANKKVKALSKKSFKKAPKKSVAPASVSSHDSVALVA